jgi:hypothetical protein
VTIAVTLRMAGACVRLPAATLCGYGAKRMSDCLHCDINELVRERIEGQENIDLGDMVARMAESLAELIMLGPKDQWAVLLAEAVRHLGNTVIEDVEGIASEATH